MSESAEPTVAAGGPTAEDDPFYINPLFFGTPGHSPTAFGCGLTLMLLIGVSFNGIICSTFIISKKLRSPQNVFIVNLGVADFFMTFWGSFVAFAIFSGKGGETFAGIVCELFSVATASPSFSSIIFIGAIGFSRYISICHPQRKAKILSWRNCIISSIGIWLYITLLIVLGYTGSGLSAYLPKMFTCGLNFTVKPFLNLLLIISSYVNVYLVIAFSYVRIYTEYRRSKRRVQGKDDSKKIGKDEFRLALQLFVIFLVYNVCLGPIYCMPLVDPMMTLHAGIYEFVLILLYANSCANFPLYMYFNVVFRNEVLRIWFRRKGTQLPGTSTNPSTSVRKTGTSTTAY